MRYETNDQTATELPDVAAIVIVYCLHPGHKGYSQSHANNANRGSASRSRDTHVYAFHPNATLSNQPSTALIPVLTLSEMTSISGWSPDGAWIGYRTGEEVTIHNIDTDAICPIGSIMQSGPYSERLWAWQADGRILVVDPDKREASVVTPCTEARDRSIMETLQGTIRGIASVSPDHHLVVMDTTQGYWIYSMGSGEVWNIELEEDAEAWGFAWSPQMTRLAVSVHLFPTRLPTRPDTPDTMTWTIDIATRTVVDRIEWPYWGGDPPRSPDWIDEKRFLIAITRAKRGPLLVTPGEGTMGIPSALFGLDCERTLCNLTNVWYIAVQPGGSYHLILTDQREPETRSLLYHSETGAVETFEGWTELSPDGRWLLGWAMSNSHGPALRPVDPAGTDVQAPDILYGQWLPDSSAMLAVHGSDVSLYRIPDGLLLAQWHAEGYTLSFPILRNVWSPDGRRVLITGEDSAGRYLLFMIAMP